MNYNKIIVVYIGDIMHCPPALSVVQVLNDLDISTVLCTIGENTKEIHNSIGKLNNCAIELAWPEYKNDINKLSKFKRMEEIKKNLWKIIDNYYDKNSLIWVVGEEGIKHLGYKLLKYNYVLHLLELNEGIYYISGNNVLKLDHIKLSHNAKAIVEAEYNRAQIIKAWWKLDNLPFVFPNKPYNGYEVHKNSEITSNQNVKSIINELSNKKIILYQGNISKERPLNEYVEAVHDLGSDYAFVMMINGSNPYPELNYSNFYVLPFINPPYHLEVTSHAYIGILSYVPIKNSYSILNTLYCAPNKIWEYSQFGLPMIGNDLPALKYLFLEYHNGICLHQLKKTEIINAILEIDNNYNDYSFASQKFFHSVDLKNVMKNILQSI